MAAEWIQEVKRLVTVELTAQAVDMRIVRNRGFAPCPVCGAEKRGDTDPRGPVGARPDGLGWVCHRCKASGDVIELLALQVAGAKAKHLTGNQWLDLHRFCAQKGWCDPVTDDKDSGKPVKVKPRPTPPPIEIPPPNRPPPAEITQAWANAMPVSEVPEVSEWLVRRGLDPTELADRDLARALSTNTPLPRWAKAKDRTQGEPGVWKPWPVAGFQLLLPFRDHTGAMVTFQGRCTLPEIPQGVTKSLSPTGYQIAGAIMACPLATQILTSGGLPDWWPAGERLQVVVTEGIPDFLTWSTHVTTDRETAPAVIGLIAGSWNDTEGIKLAKRFPVADWIIRTHRDEAGDKYAAAIYKALKAVDRRHTIRRA